MRYGLGVDRRCGHFARRVVVTIEIGPYLPKIGGMVLWDFQVTLVGESICWVSAAIKIEPVLARRVSDEPGVDGPDVVILIGIGSPRPLLREWDSR
jgi:hypothetical protein